MKYQQDPLLQSLAAMQIEPAGAATSFAAKLARDNGWDRSFAEAVTAEYRRFLYLAATGDGPATPSDAIDKAWHLHLTYSRHYWDELCGRILGRPLHHDPSVGGTAEDERHQGQYADTLRRYRATFGAAPPARIWPHGAAPASVAVSPKRRAALFARAGAAAAACTLLAACAAIADATGASERKVTTGFFVFAGVAAVIGFIFWGIRGSAGAGSGKRDGSGSCGSSCGSIGSSCGSIQSESSGGSESSSGSEGGGSSCGGGGCGGGGGD